MRPSDEGSGTEIGCHLLRAAPISYGLWHRGAVSRDQKSMEGDEGFAKPGTEDRSTFLDDEDQEAHKQLRRTKPKQRGEFVREAPLP